MASIVQNEMDITQEEFNEWKEDMVKPFMNKFRSLLDDVASFYELEN